MSEPKISRPHFPKGYIDHPTALLPWSQVEQRLVEARNYWLGTVRPDGRPHVIPKWGVWVDGRFYCDGSPQTRHARNIALNPHVTLHLESGDNVVIIEGTAREAPRPTPQLGKKIAEAYRVKYASLGYAPEPTQWDEGGLYEVTPRLALAWTSFTQDPTRFEFEQT